MASKLRPVTGSLPPAEREGSMKKDKGRRLKTVTNLARNQEIECIALQPATDG
jgi:hypothetical protein